MNVIIDLDDENNEKLSHECHKLIRECRRGNHHASGSSCWGDGVFRTSPCASVCSSGKYTKNIITNLTSKL